MVSFLSEREEEIMRKRAISWALTASMVLSMLSGFIPGQKAYRGGQLEENRQDGGRDRD